MKLSRSFQLDIRSSMVGAYKGIIKAKNSAVNVKPISGLFKAVFTAQRQLNDNDRNDENSRVWRMQCVRTLPQFVITFDGSAYSLQSTLMVRTSTKDEYKRQRLQIFSQQLLHWHLPFIKEKERIRVDNFTLVKLLSLNAHKARQTPRSATVPGYSLDKKLLTDCFKMKGDYIQKACGQGKFADCGLWCF